MARAQTGLRWSVLCIVIAGSMSIASAKQPLFREECVGRIRFLLPADAEVAAMVPADFRVELESGVPQPPFRFSDGHLASSSYINYGGRLFITHPVSSDDRSAFLKIARASRESVDLAVNREYKKDNDGLPLQFESLPTKEQVGVAWRVNTRHTAYLELGKYSILWAGKKNLQETGHDFTNIITGALERPMFSIPEQQGVCLPYAFIRDDGMTFSSIRTSFRLASHPDVLIVVQDSSASPSIARSKTTVEQLNDFWGQFEFSRNVLSVRSAWHVPSTRRMKLGNRDALASFVKIARANGVMDFGYLAIATGGAGSTIDTSDLELIAIRDSQLAQQKGVSPISEVDFLAMIEKIVKSMKRGNF
jgi:hypothetical protein